LVFETSAVQGKLTSANTVEQFDAGNCDGGVVEVLEAEHGPRPGLDTPMILFDQICGFGQQTTSPRLDALVTSARQVQDSQLLPSLFLANSLSRVGCFPELSCSTSVVLTAICFLQWYSATGICMVRL
jgi:hypothetical protein